MPLEPEVKAQIDAAVEVARKHIEEMLQDEKLRPGVVAMLTAHVTHKGGGTHKYLGQMYGELVKQIARGEL